MSPPAPRPRGEGYFYVICLVPDLAPARIKLGWTTDLPGRLTAHRTSAPTAVAVRAWRLPYADEQRLIAALTEGASSRLGRESFDVGELGAFLTWADLVFAALGAHRLVPSDAIGPRTPVTGRPRRQPRRGQRQGYIQELPNGRWRGQLMIARRRYSFTASTRQGALAALDRLRAAHGTTS